MTIDDWPIVFGRNWLYGSPSYSSVDYEPKTEFYNRFAEVGEDLTVRLYHNSRRFLSAEILRIFGTRCTEATCDDMHSTVRHVFPVQHDRLCFVSHNHQVDDRYKAIENLFGFVSHVM